MSGLDNVLAAFGGAGAPPKESPLEAIVTQQGGSLRPIAVGEFQPPRSSSAPPRKPLNSQRSLRSLRDCGHL